MKTIAILGASGFIGSHLADYFYNNTSYNLKLFSRSNSNSFDKYDEKRVEFITGDLNHFNFDDFLIKVDFVYHLASSTIPATNWNNAEAEIEDSLIPTLKLLESCSKSKIKKVIYASSGGTVYGKQDGEVFENTATSPFSPYGIVKLTTENFLSYFEKRDGLRFDILRIGNPYGPRQVKGVITHWLKLALKNMDFEIFGDGEIIRDYIYIGDLVKIMAQSVESEVSHTYNVGSGIGYSLKELAEIIIKVTKTKSKINFIENRDSDNNTVILNIDKLKSDYPKLKLISLEDGIKKTWDALKNS